MKNKKLTNIYCLKQTFTRSKHKNQYYIKDYQDFANESVEMKYDNNGNLIKDLDRKILSIKYNVLNLPSEIIFANGHNQYLCCQWTKI
jgi:hypothetical protein